MARIVGGGDFFGVMAECAIVFPPYGLVNRGLTPLNTPQARVQALLEGMPGLNFTYRTVVVRSRQYLSSSRLGAVTSLTGVKTFEDRIGLIPCLSRGGSEINFAPVHTVVR